jgi:hypothetical protein
MKGREAAVTAYLADLVEAFTGPDVERFKERGYGWRYRPDLAALLWRQQEILSEILNAVRARREPQRSTRTARVPRGSAAKDQPGAGDRVEPASKEASDGRS